MYRLAPGTSSPRLVGTQQALPKLYRSLISLTVTFCLVTLAVVSACGSPSAPGTPPPSTPATTSSATSGAGKTFGQAASAGQTVYSQSCGKCHDNSGQGRIGPALIGSGTNIGHFGNAQNLFDFMSAAMPQDAPGSLPREAYLNVLGFVLVQNGFVAERDSFDPNRLSDIQLKK